MKLTVKNYDDYCVWRSDKNKLRFLLSICGACVGGAIGYIILLFFDMESAVQGWAVAHSSMLLLFFVVIGLVVGAIYAKIKAVEFDNMEITEREYISISKNSELKEEIARVKNSMGTESDKRITYKEMYPACLAIKANIISSVKSSVSGQLN